VYSHSIFCYFQTPKKNNEIKNKIDFLLLDVFLFIVLMLLINDDFIIIINVVVGLHFLTPVFDFNFFTFFFDFDLKA